MDARLKKIQVTPVKRDSEGDVTTPETAVITFEMPIDSASQKNEIIKLLDVLTSEWVNVTVTDKQLRLEMTEAHRAEGLQLENIV